MTTVVTSANNSSWPEAEIHGCSRHRIFAAHAAPKETTHTRLTSCSMLSKQENGPKETIGYHYRTPRPRGRWKRFMTPSNSTGHFLSK